MKCVPYLHCYQIYSVLYVPRYPSCFTPERSSTAQRLFLFPLLVDLQNTKAAILLLPTVQCTVGLFKNKTKRVFLLNKSPLHHITAPVLRCRPILLYVAAHCKLHRSTRDGTVSVVPAILLTKKCYSNPIPILFPLLSTSIFQGNDPSDGRLAFWDELFLLKVRPFLIVGRRSPVPSPPSPPVSLALLFFSFFFFFSSV